MRDPARAAENRMSLHFRNSWLEILIVAGDPERLRLNHEALRSERGDVHLARDGAETRALLRGGGEREGRTRPNVVLLDLTTPESDWPAIAAAIVEAALTGPIVALEWLDDQPGRVADENAPAEERAPQGDLSRLIRRAILQKRTQDERAASLLIDQASGDSPSAVAAGQVRFGAAGDPGSDAGIGRPWLYLTLREDTEAGILDGLIALKKLAERLPRDGGLGRVEPAVTEPVCPNELIGQVVEGYRPVAEARGVRLLEIDDEYAPRISADGPGLLAALGVLTAYILHFARPGLDVRISTWVAGDEAVDFKVSLDGAGMAEAHLPLLADAFAAISPIVEAHGARLRFGSSWGRWCGFSFGLPTSLSRPAWFDDQDDE